jgi:O-antigen/teichoic acid export membrane protein
VARREALARYARGPVIVAAGAGVLGVCSYVFLTVAARRLGPVAFGELSALWAIVFGFVAGLWYPFEQELTRLVATADDVVAAADLRRVAITQSGALVVAEVVAAVVALRSSSLFGGVGGLALALLVSVLSLGLSSFQRGRLLGARRFGWVAAQQSVDGVARAVGAVGCAVTGASVGEFGLVLACAPLVGVLAALPGTPRSDRRAAPTRSWARVLRDLLALLAGSYLAIVLLNVGPLVVRFFSGAEATGRFMAVFVVARLPLFFAGAVVSGLLPTFVDARRSDDPARFLRVVRTVTLLLTLVAVPGAVVLGLAGPWLARTFFGSAYAGDLLTSVLLAVSSAFLLVGLVLQGALVADDRQRAVAWTWLCGTVAFLLVLVVLESAHIEVGVGTALAYVVAGVVVVVAMLVTLTRSRRPA